MLMAPGEEFSADRIVEKALRQDVGPDPSAAMNKTNYKYEDENNILQVQHEYTKKYRDKNPMLAPEAYYAGHDIIGRSQKQFTQFDQEKPPVFINKPLTRSQVRKKYMRTVGKKDIDYKNTPLITKFLNEQGKLYNRF